MGIIGFIYSLPRRAVISARRRKALKHVYDYPPTQDGWEKMKMPILGSDESGSYFDPYILNDENGDYLYISRRKDHSIVRFDLLPEMRVANEVLTLSGEKDAWDEIVNRADVIKTSNGYMMWYTGQYNGKSCIGLAQSKDGIHFTKYHQNPVLEPEGAIEADSVMNPCVLYNREKKVFEMWYAAGETYEPDVLCYATSEDGIHWDKYPQNPVLQKSENDYDLKKVGGCDVLYANGGYIMYYIGYHDVDTARICCAVSQNGIDWERIPNNPIVSPSPSSWDGHAAYKPAYYQKNGIEYIVYNGRFDDLERVGAVQRKYLLGVCEK